MKINGFTIAGFVFAIVALLVGGDFSFLLTFFGIALSVFSVGYKALVSLNVIPAFLTNML